MKTRTGFVSNSSSSSFVICSKKGELTKEKLIGVFGVPKDSLLRPLAEDIAETLANANETTIKELLEDCDCDKIEDIDNDDLQEVLKVEGGTIYTGSTYTDGDCIEEQLLCTMRINYEDDEVIIKSEGAW